MEKKITTKELATKLEVDQKITTKELATKLGVDHSELLRKVKQLGITNKNSTTSTLSEEESHAVSALYSQEQSKALNSTTSSGDTNVIVRRKRNTKSSHSSEKEQDVQDKNEKNTKKNENKMPKEQQTARIIKPAPKNNVSKDNSEITHEEQAKDTESTTLIQKDADQTNNSSHISTENGQKKQNTPIKENQPPKNTKEENTEVKVSEQSPQQTDKKHVATVVNTAQKENKEESQSSEKGSEKNAPLTKNDVNMDKKQNNAAKIITPAKSENKSENKSEDKKKTINASAQPDGTSTNSILPPAGVRSFAQRIDVSDRQEAPRSQVRVISKPDPKETAKTQESRSHNNRSRDGNSAGRDYRDGNDNRNRNNNRNRNDNSRQDGNKNNTRNDRPYNNRNNDGTRQDGRNEQKTDNRGDRPFNNSRQDGRNDRSNNTRGAFNNQRQDAGFMKDKDADSNNRPRPQARPHTPRPSMEGLPFHTEEQSRKKRNKNKKTNDFSESTPQQDFKFSKYSLGMEDEDSPRRRRKTKKKEVKAPTNITAPMKAAKRKLRIEETIRVADMAHQMGLKSNEIIKALFGLGVMATINSSLDFDTAQVVASEFDYEVEKVGFSVEAAILPTETDSPEQLKPRPPVVTIMGHVDHGKTSLLDAIRQTNVTAGEAGGITQHIGAYHVRTKRGDIVFLDTPGHEAFTAMRLRGAQVTDIVVLVVAADDGVMEQTKEAISHAKAANVPIIVAVNKMDKEGANPDRVLRELAELGLQAESWGGDTVTTMLSAKKRTGIDELLELLSLQAELMELKANPDKHARGHIVEAKLDKGRGPVATVLIQEGTLHQGDSFVCGVFAGRVRALFNDQGRKIHEAGPSMPVEVQGFEGVPEAGEEFVSLQDEKVARRIAEARAIKQREKILAKESKVTLETFLARKADTAEAMVLNLIVKADVQGSLEAITEALNKLSTEKVRISILHGGAGSISESDVMLAAASEAIVIGFNVRPTAKVKEIAESEHVDIRFYDIIYKLVEEIRAAMAGLLAPVQKEVYLGQAEVRDIFTLSKVGTIAGSYVTDGKMLRNAGVRLLREGVVIYTGKISSLKRFKDDAKEVLKGFECGISLENYNDIKVGDVIEAFEMKEEAGKL